MCDRVVVRGAGLFSRRGRMWCIACNITGAKLRITLSRLHDAPFGGQARRREIRPHCKHGHYTTETNCNHNVRTESTDTICPKLIAIAMCEGANAQPPYAREYFRRKNCVSVVLPLGQTSPMGRLGPMSPSVPSGRDMS